MKNGIILFDRGIKTNGKNINNALEEDLDNSTIAKFATVEKELNECEPMTKFGISEFSDKPTNYYNLDVFISVGYRVKSQEGIIFRRWATINILI